MCQYSWQRFAGFDHSYCEHIFNICFCSSLSSSCLVTYTNEPHKNCADHPANQLGIPRFFISCSSVMLHMLIQWHHMSVMLSQITSNFTIRLMTWPVLYRFMSWYHLTLPALTLVAFNDPIITFLRAAEHVPWEINESLLPGPPFINMV